MKPGSVLTSELVTIDAIRAAADTLRSVAVRTPLLRDSALSDEVGSSVLLKPEMLQRGGAFKFRGAYSLIAGLTPVERAQGVVAPSSGNHAQAVALAAKLFGIRATVVMPTTVTEAKRAGAERLGARIDPRRHDDEGSRRSRCRDCGSGRRDHGPTVR